jgi:hypothetical protein
MKLQNVNQPKQRIMNQASAIQRGRDHVATQMLSPEEADLARWLLADCVQSDDLRLKGECSHEAPLAVLPQWRLA